MTTPPNNDAGGQGGNGGTPPNPADDKGTQGGGQDPNAGSGAGGTGGNDKGSGAPSQQFKGEFDPDKAARLIDNLRSDLDAEKTKRTSMESQFSEFMGKFGQLFGGGEQKQLTPEQIAQKAEESDRKARESAIHLTVFRTASKHGGDPDALLDSAAFVSAVNKLDPASDTFAASVENAVKQAVEKNPRLKAADTTPPPPAKGGFDHGNQGNGGKRQLTAAEVEKLRRENPEALVKAQDEGLLRDFLAS
ncbi:hypothetical protein [Streptomyces sp. CA-106131]|uniref:hypothetical protein n=1 Tax=Streptomyces sp. CA-106131 TaxID=3240045 RepID=UPI003D9354AF